MRKRRETPPPPSRHWLFRFENIGCKVGTPAEVEIVKVTFSTYDNIEAVRAAVRQRYGDRAEWHEWRSGVFDFYGEMNIPPTEIRHGAITVVRLLRITHVGYQR